MNPLLRKFQEKMVASCGGPVIPDFIPGDTIAVYTKIVEGTNERVQKFEGLCIRRHRGSGYLDSTFTVRKVSNGEGVERVFVLHSPRIVKIEVVKRGVVRRAKLYYMRDRFGKAARIKERK